MHAAKLKDGVARCIPSNPVLRRISGDFNLALM